MTDEPETVNERLAGIVASGLGVATETHVLMPPEFTAVEDASQSTIEAVAEEEFSV